MQVQYQLDVYTEHKLCCLFSKRYFCKNFFFHAQSILNISAVKHGHGVFPSYVVTMAIPSVCLLFTVVEDEVTSPRIRDVTV